MTEAHAFFTHGVHPAPETTHQGKSKSLTKDFPVPNNLHRPT